MTNKTFFLDQHGCAKNQVDGELLVTRLTKMGMVRTDDPAKADLILINSCGFIESAKKESLDAVMDAHDAYPNAKVLLAGCLAERYADVFKTELPEADGIIGNGDLSLIDDTVKAMFNNERPVVKAPQKGVCCGDRDTLLSFKGSAYVKITEGCNNKCTFCAIPIIRGELRSRRAEETVAEIKALVASGVHEINLIGQDLAAYGCGEEDNVFDNGKTMYDAMYKGLKEPILLDKDFEANNGHSYLYLLMQKISEISGDFWVRLLYIHPDHFNPDILTLMQKDKRFLPYFDIPFQSGDTEVIHTMNRKGSFESYAKLIETIRTALPEACIRTTFLTGFPGETKEQAAKTEEFLKTIQSDWSGCFAYSCEEDTPAAKMKKQISNKVAEKRAETLQAIQAEITQNRLRDRTGKVYDVLIEEIIENHEGTDEGLAIGRAWFQAPDVDGSVVLTYDLDDEEAVKAIQPGNMVKVNAYASSQVDLNGEYIGRS